MRNDTSLSEHARALSAKGATKGGKVRASSLTKSERQAIARRAAEARWDRHDEELGVLDVPRAKKWFGKLDLGGYQISCAVLDNGQRILVERSMATALGTKGSGAYWERKRRGIDAENGRLLPEYISAKYLTPFVGEELTAKLSNPIRYINQNGILTMGVDATVLPEICDVWITAKNAGALTETQQINVAERAYVLMKGFATVGIIALIDAATGYERIRDQKALQEILDRFLLPYKAAWARRFPEDFYKEIFRLNNWKYDPSSVKRPSVIGNITNDVYNRIAPGILTELRERTPKDDKGRRKHRFHQLFTEDIGHPKLQEHLSNVITLMKASSNMHEYHRLIERAKPAFGDNLRLDIPE